MPVLTRPQKITFADMHEAGVRGILVTWRTGCHSTAAVNCRHHRS
jgi:hypothetical protein